MVRSFWMLLGVALALGCGDGGKTAKFEKRLTEAEARLARLEKRVAKAERASRQKTRRPPRPKATEEQAGPSPGPGTDTTQP
jgi:hypothetical protein